MRRLPVLAAACEGCGDCCDPVTTRPIAELDAATRAFAAAHWHEVPLPPAPPGWRRRPGTVAYRCDAFDPATRRCTAYATRPPVCAGYPWYGRDPSPDRYLYPRCVHQLDVEPTNTELITTYGGDDGDYYGD